MTGCPNPLSGKLNYSRPLFPDPFFPVVEGKSEMVLTVLRARFNQVPQEVEEAIRKITDPTALDSWASHAATCNTLEEFEKAIH